MAAESPRSAIRVVSEPATIEVFEQVGVNNESVIADPPGDTAESQQVLALAPRGTDSLPLSFGYEFERSVCTRFIRPGRPGPPAAGAHWSHPRVNTQPTVPATEIDALPKAGKGRTSSRRFRQPAQPRRLRW